MVKAMKLQLFYHMTKIDCASSHHEQFNQIINRSNIIITGNLDRSYQRSSKNERIILQQTDARTESCKHRHQQKDAC